MQDVYKQPKCKGKKKRFFFFSQDTGKFLTGEYLPT